MVLRSRSWFASCPMVVAALLCSGTMLLIFANTYYTLQSAHPSSPKSIVSSGAVVAPNAGPLVIVNNKAMRLPDRAVIRTSLGDITLELLLDAAPRHVHNFVSLARSGWYNDTSLYRLEKGFCLQGGGWPKKNGPLNVPLETQMYSQYPNKQWAVSAARMSDPNSASAEFSIMLGDNSKWLGPGGSDAHGYSVFANVVGGKDVVEAIVAQGIVKAQGGLNYLEPAIPIRSIDA